VKLLSSAKRFSSAKQVVVLVGESKKNLYRFVRWELETALNLKLPIIVVNLNGKREMDPILCPPILRGTDAVHVSFQMKIIQPAVDDAYTHVRNISAGEEKDWRYGENVYRQLRL
jgi:hypothetical protein